MPPLTPTPRKKKKKASSPLHEGLVALVEVVRDGEDGKDGGYEAGDARREYEAVGEERGHPHAEAELAGQDLAHGPSQPLAPGLLVDALGALLLLELGERGAQGARDRVLGPDQAQLVGRHPEQRKVLCIYPLRYVPSRALYKEEKDSED